MIIAIASGKGGTGKTTVATNLARVMAGAGQKVCYADADVEAPNGQLFLQPVIADRKPVQVSVPAIDERICNLCRQCEQMCEYGAVICLGPRMLVFPELCHGCGGCQRVCPNGAITEVLRLIGRVETGWCGEPVAAGTLLEDILPRAAASDAPLPVADEKGSVIGYIDRTRLLQALSRTGDT